MAKTSIQSYGAEVHSTPPRTKTFPAGSDAAAALRSARRWVEDQARDFIGKHSLPKNPWEAGAIYAGETGKGSPAEPLAELTVYPSQDEYVFDWDDED